MRKLLCMAATGFLGGCGSITLPAAVQLADGTALVGTTTAAISGGRFSVASPDRALTCSGTYDAFDTSLTISVPVTCTNGLSGTAFVNRAPDGMSGRGVVSVSDGTIARVAFGNNAGAVLTSPTVFAGAATRTYTGNCPTPESLDSAGRRCGARSAASKPGGYDGYGSWARRSASTSSSGSTFVRSYYRRDGTFVRSHTRSRRR